MPSGASAPASINASEDDLSVSDLDSDVEPEDLMNAYLSAKTRLYELRPELVAELFPKGRKRGAQRAKVTEISDMQPISPAIQKLQKKLRQIESDILFDSREADAQWVERRNVLAQETASRRKLGLANVNASNQPSSPRDLRNMPTDAGTPELIPEVAISTIGTEDVDDDDLLGPMFLQESGPLETNSIDHGASSNASSTTIIVRDFGKFTGIHPRRVLEEACRSRLVIGAR